MIQLEQRMAELAATDATRTKKHHECHAAVSYTHLDVYKRQRIYSALIEIVAAAVFIIPIWCIYNKLCFHSWKPVSYTHLDVYKRQVM